MLSLAFNNVALQLCRYRRGESNLISKSVIFSMSFRHYIVGTTQRAKNSADLRVLLAPASESRVGCGDCAIEHAGEKLVQGI